MKFKEFVNRAIEEQGVLEVTFIKVTDNQPRTAVFAVAADVSPSYKDSVVVSPKVLKTIKKNHDRVYAENLDYVGSLLTFPELITDKTPPHDKTRAIDLPNGAGQWQWRRLYVEQITEVKYNGEVIWQNNDLFSFSISTAKGERLTTMTADEYQAQRNAIAAKLTQKVADEAAGKVRHQKIVEIAKTLTEKDVAVDLNYMNGWPGDDSDEALRIAAVCMKHDWLCRQKPETHALHNVSDAYHQMHGFDHYQCPCGFQYRVDSSD